MSCQQLNTLVVKLRTDAILRCVATLLVLIIVQLMLLSGRVEGSDTDEPVLTDGLVAQWLFNETGGTTATDTVSGLVGNLLGQGGATPTFVDGRFRNALYMDGTGDDDDRSKDTPGMVVDLTGTGVIDWGTSTDWTLAYWLRTDPSYEFVSADTIYSANYGPDGTFSAAAFQFTATRAGGFNGHYQRYGSSPTVTSSPPGEFEFEAGNPVDIKELVTDDTWHHYAFVVDRDGDTVSYIDGFEVLRQTMDNTGIDFFGATAIDIGFDDYNGSMDDLRLYNKALTQQDMDMLAPPPEATDKFTWSSADEGDWHFAGNWTPVRGGPPNGNQIAIFGAGIETATTVVVDSDISARGVEFDNANSYAIGGVASVNLIAGTDLDGNEDPTRIDVLQGSHQFQAVVNLQADTSANVASDSTLNFNNQLNLGGHTLTKSGNGKLLVKNDDVAGNGGAIDVQAGVFGGGGTVDGNLTNSSTVAPGNSSGILTIDGNYTQGASGTLALEIGGGEAGQQHDRLVVNGDAAVDGTVTVELVDGFSPQNMATFDVLDTNSFSGTPTFDFTLAALDGGLTWDTSQFSTFGLLCAGSCGIGSSFNDYDNDGTWNLGDLNLVLFNWQQEESSLPVEWVNQRPTVVGLDSLNAVLFNWQQSASLAVVPEPATVLFVITGLLALAGDQRQSFCCRSR